MKIVLVKAQAFQCYSSQLHYNLLTNGCYILPVKIMTQYRKIDYLELLIFIVYSYILSVIYGALNHIPD